MIFDTINNIENYKGLDRVYSVLEYLAKTDFSEIPNGRYELDGENVFYMLQSYVTEPDKTRSEAHKKYIDVQYMLDGEELIGVAPLSCPKTEVEARPEGDIWFYECDTQPIKLFAGSFMVLYPNDIHLPGMAVTQASNVRKVVVKIACTPE